MPKTREHWIDVLRGGSVASIMAFHSTGLLRYGDVSTDPPWMVTLNKASRPYWMPTLSFLAGLVAEPGMSDNGRQVDRFRGTVYPYAVWTVIYAATFRVSPTKRMALRLATGGTYLFFLPFLFAFGLLSSPIRKVPPVLVTAVALATSAVAPRLLPAAPSRFTEQFWYLLGMFNVGRWASQNVQTWHRIESNRSVLVVAAAAMSTGAAAEVADKEVDYQWEWAWAPILALIPLARTARAVESSAISAPLRFIGRNSIVFYTTHFPVAYEVIRRSKDHDGTRVFAKALGASLAAGTMLSWVRQKNRHISHLFSV